MAHIKIVDDEPAILDTLSEILSDEGYRISTAPDGVEALKALQHSQADVVLLDIWMPGVDGMEVLAQIHKDYPDTTVIMMSGHGSIETAVRAIKLGAYDYVEKPLSLEKVCLTVAHALREKSLKDENTGLRKKIERRYRLIGQSPQMLYLLNQIKTAGPTNGRVLISGENGTGKELVAIAVHNTSLRAKSSFVEVNCAAIPENLIESELLGHEKGAFTGADSRKTGRFEQAHGGTIFLDEIGDMSLSTQAKVLRVLQEQRFCRVGGTEQVEVDVRVVAASNKNLPEEIKAGNFREDLYYRLNVIPLFVPPLRERKDDIPLLIDYFLKSVCEEERLKSKTVSPEACAMLMEYSWPGNVRELKNMVERLVIMTPGKEIMIEDIKRFSHPEAYKETSGLYKDSSFKGAKEQFEREFIINSLSENNWNISKTAEVLKIERSHLHKKIKTLGIEVNPDYS